MDGRIGVICVDHWVMQKGGILWGGFDMPDEKNR